MSEHVLLERAQPLPFLEEMGVVLPAPACPAVVVDEALEMPWVAAAEPVLFDTRPRWVVRPAVAPEHRLCRFARHFEVPHEFIKEALAEPIGHPLLSEGRARAGSPSVGPDVGVWLHRHVPVDGAEQRAAVGGTPPRAVRVLKEVGERILGLHTGARLWSVMCVQLFCIA